MKTAKISFLCSYAEDFFRQNICRLVNCDDQIFHHVSLAIVNVHVGQLKIVYRPLVCIQLNVPGMSMCVS